MSYQQPMILLTNDDGIHADGLQKLRDFAQTIGEVIIAAPNTEQSAVGHSITLYEPIKAQEVFKQGTFYGYAIGGTPADSVKLAIHYLLARKPDIVISGINNGANLGVNVLYSGTVSAATEGAMLGVPSIAVSIAARKNPPFETTFPFLEKITKWVIKNKLPEGVALNVNVPATPLDKIKGIKITRQSLSRIDETFERREDPRGNFYYWLSSKSTPEDTENGVDIKALHDGYVSVTPLFYDLTAHKQLEELTCSFANQ
ncbi:MAG: 5'/3'-nucleotidase SurE [Desulfomonilaceae bacterium]